MMEFSAFMQWAFLGLISGGVVILYQMKSSMNELNIKLAVFVERLEHQQEKLKVFDTRLIYVENIIKNNFN